MNLQRKRRPVAARVLQLQQQKLPEAPHLGNSTSGQFALERRGIVNKIRFAQPHLEDAPPRQHGSQSPSDSFHFWQFRHILLYHSLLQTSTVRLAVFALKLSRM